VSRTRGETVPSDVVRNHVTRLVQMGMAKGEIAARAGVSRETVYNLTRRPTVTEETARRVLAVPAPPELDLAWADRAACRTDAARDIARQHGTTVLELFFGASYVDADGAPREHLPAARAVVHLCCGCDVREECLNQAIDQPEQFGIWGGLTQRQINEMRRKRNR
jgi:Transcription factor WhiB